MAPVKVFGSAVFANAARVMACLEEVGVEYEVVEVDYMAREHKGLEHLARNPFGQIPAFQDGDVMLFESRAIAKYVLRKYAKSPQDDDLLREGNPEEAAMVDVWTEVEAHHYFPAVAPIFYECVVYPARLGTVPDQRIVGESLENLSKVLDVYEAHLSRTKSEFLAGNFFSFADLNHFPFTFHVDRDAARVAVRLVPARQGVVGEGCGEAVAQEDQRPYGDQAMIIDCTSRRCNVARAFQFVRVPSQ